MIFEKLILSELFAFFKYYWKRRRICLLYKFYAFYLISPTALHIIPPLNFRWEIPQSVCQVAFVGHDRPPTHDKYINIDYPLHNPHLDTRYCAVMKTWHSCAWSYCSVRLYLVGLANNMVVTKLKKLRFKFMSLLVQRVESTVDRWIPSQRTRNAESISI